MTKSQLANMESLLHDLSDRLNQVERHADKMELILMVREPGSSAAADAYEGLRKQIVAAVTDRLSHLTQLVQFDSALRNGADSEVLSAMVKGWMEAASLAVINDATHDQRELLFDVVEDLGGPAEALEPSYVDSQSSRVIRKGRMRLGPVVEVLPWTTEASAKPADEAAGTGAARGDEDDPDQRSEG